MVIIIAFIIFLSISGILDRIPSIVWKILGYGILIYFLFGNITPLLFILLAIISFILLVKYIIDKSW